MPRIHHLLVASTLIGCAQIASAQAAGASPAAPDVIVVTPIPVPQGAQPAQPAQSAGDDAMTSGAPPQDMQAGQPRSSGVVVGTIVQTRPPSGVGASAAELSGDPLIMRREARARARQEYRARVEAAKREYREDLRAAEAIGTQRGQSGY